MPSFRLLPVLLLVAMQAASVATQVFSCVGGTVYVVAHPDDDLLFQSPDLQTDVSASNCITTVILTAGDSGTTGSTYALSREQGNAAAYAHMAGVDSTWTEFETTLGGQSVLVTTLKGASQIQRVHFRFPDGNMDGSGFASTGYQSLRNLYFGSISQIRNQPGTATFTLSALKQALGEIITARQPSYVRTLDYMSDYDAGDHADHLTTARITSEIAGQYASNATLAGYMGYPVQNLPPTMGLNDGNFLAKCDAFFSYTPFDYAECQSLTDCWNAGRGETYWLLRQYIVNENLAEQSYTGSAEVPVTLPNGTNVAPLGQALASSQSSIQPASAAIDGNIQGYPGNYSAEWSSNGETTTAWWGVLWNDLYTITSVVLYDRPNQNDWISGGTLEFSDGSSVSFGALANDGSATLISLGGPVVTQYIKMAVTSVSASTSSAGLAEFQAYGTICPGCRAGNSLGNGATTTETSRGIVSGNGAFADLALQAHAFASSSYAQQGADRAIDGVISGYPSNSSAEWASYQQGAGAWINVTWDAYYLVDSLVFWDRPNTNDWITGGRVSFSDGSSVPVGALNNDGSATVLNLSTAVNISSLKFTVSSADSSSSSVGLSEIGAFYSQPQTPVNLSVVARNPGVAAPVVGDLDAEDWSDDLALQNATATSSSAAQGQDAPNAINGVPDGYREDGTGNYAAEWASSGEGAGAWFNVSWPSAIKIQQISLYDRPNLVDQITGALLLFDDGSRVSTGALNNDGTATNISVPGIVTTSVKMVVTAVSSSTSACGLAEFAVYGSSPVLANSTLAGNSTLAANSTLVGNSTLAANSTLAGNSTLAANSTSLVPNSTTSSLFASATLNATFSGSLNVSASITSFLPSSTGAASLNSSSAAYNSSAIASSTAFNALSTSTSFNASSAFSSATGFNSSSLSAAATASRNASLSNALPTVSANASTVPSTSLNSTSASTTSSGRNSSSSATPTASTPASASPTFSASALRPASASANASSVLSSALNSAHTSGSATASGVSSSSVVSSTGLSSSSAPATRNASSSALSTSSTIISASSLAASSASSSIRANSTTVLPSSTSFPHSSSTASSGSSTSVRRGTVSSVSPTISSTASSSASLASASGMLTITRSNSASSSAVPSTSTRMSSSASSTPAALPTASVASTVNIARLAGVTVKASSSISKSPPSGAVDASYGGVSVFGWGDSSAEWVSTGTKGQWIELSLGANYLVRDLYLVGRTNSWQSVTSGVLNFTDGSIINVGSIPSSGGHVSLGTAGLMISGVRLTITGTSLTTTQAGLAEIELYSKAAPTTGLIGSLGNAVGSTLSGLLGLFGLR